MKLAIALLCTAAAAAAADETLRHLAGQRGLHFTAAINANHLSPEADYRAAARTQYNTFTAENHCKWKFIQPTKGNFDFSGCDHVLQFAKNNNAAFRGHNLCWGNMNPEWLGKLNAADKRQALQDHIRAVGAHYGRQAFAWDVVNEAITDNAKAIKWKKSNVWYPAVQDYIEVAFHTAREAFGPNVKLFYNDYGADAVNTKSNRIYKLVKSLREQGVPIDGVGFQMHIRRGDAMSKVGSIKKNLQRFSDLGLEVHVTEMDVGGSTWNANNEDKQARLFAGVLQACLEVPNCKSFGTWGFTDKYTWKGTSSHPLPFDENYQPKAAVGAMMDVLRPGLGASNNNDTVALV